ncbi:MAG: hypothetical protein AAF363_09415 [Bacteroidota bacterium]
MRKFLEVITSLLILASITSCTDKICPAYQSFYIFDDNHRDDLFSPFTSGDSIPKEEFVRYAGKKKKQGIVAQSRLFPFRITEDRLRVVEQEYVMPGTWEPPQEDGITSASDTGSFNTDLIGELVIVEDDFEAQRVQEQDSLAQEREAKPNVDQEYYEYLFGKELKADLEMREAVKNGTFGQEEDTASVGEEAKEKVGFIGFFKNLFKKKDKSEVGDEALEGEEGSGSTDAESLTEENSGDGDASVDTPKKKKKEKVKKEKQPREKKEKKPKKVKEEKPKKEKKPKKKKEEGEEKEDLGF